MMMKNNGCMTTRNFRNKAWSFKFSQTSKFITDVLNRAKHLLSVFFVTSQQTKYSSNSFCWLLSNNNTFTPQRMQYRLHPPGALQPNRAVISITSRLKHQKYSSFQFIYLDYFAYSEVFFSNKSRFSWIKQAEKQRLYL